MIKTFFPKLYLDSIYEINEKLLQAHNIQALIFDIDNTLVPYDIALPDEKIIEHFNYLRNLGYKLAVFSNNNKKRVTKFAEKLDIEIIFNANKPMIYKLKRLSQILKTSPAHTALVGDQIFTDVWCGNRAGVFTILVKPVSDRDIWITKFKRKREQKIIGRYLEWLKTQKK